MSKVEENNKSKMKKWFWILGLSPFILLSLLLIAAAFSKLPTFEELENPKSNLATEVLTSDNKVIGKYWNTNRTNIAYEDLPQHLVQALISTEDERYYNHSGVDARGTTRAILYLGSKGGGSTITQQLAKLLFSERPRTKARRIFQKAQEWIIAGRLEKAYSKNEILTMYLNQYDFNYNAVGIQSAANIYFGKDPDDLSIEESAMLVGMLKNSSLYNPIRREELVIKRRGVVLGQMARNGFITSEVRDSLNTLPLGISFTPQSHDEGLAPYFREILRGEITEIMGKKDSDGNYVYINANGKPYNVYNDGLKIFTTLDSKLQEYAEYAVREHLSTELQKDFDRLNKRNRNAPFSDDVDKKQIESILKSSILRTDRYKVATGKLCGFCKRNAYMSLIKEDGIEYYTCTYDDHANKYQRPVLNEEEIEEYFKTPVNTTVFTWEGYKDTLMSPMDSIIHHKKYLQAGLMSVDPKNGFVKAWVGGIDYKYFKYDHVKQGRRQVGSTFKPIIYATAIRDGYSPCYELPNQKTCFDMPEGQPDWCPKNSSGKYGGVISLKAALANSVNTVTAWVMKQFGPDAIIRLASDMGIQSDLAPVPSLCLGVADLSVYEMTAANSTFANKGVYIEPIVIVRIEDKNGNTIYEAEPITREALDEETAYTMLDIMKGTIDGAYNKSTDRTSGTAQRLRRDDKRRKYDNIGNMPIACKTGTTQNNSDGWFIGLTPDLCTGIWVGAEDRSIRFSSTAYGQGANTALPIWGYYMKKVYGDESLDISQEDFEKPEGYVKEDCSQNNSNGFQFEDENLEDIFEEQENMFN